MSPRVFASATTSPNKETATRLQALFAAAVDLPVAERAQMLERECAGDAALLAELRELLDMDERLRSTTVQPIARGLANMIAAFSPDASLTARRLNGPGESSPWPGEVCNVPPGADRARASGEPYNRASPAGDATMLRQMAAVTLGLVLLWVFVHWARDPHRTALPFGTTDLSSVQSELKRLPAEERRLVETYVKRSNGDVLPPKFADPDDPLTARTFAEAIVLQQRWEVKLKEMEAKAAVLQAQRDAAVAPLREAVEARLIKAELVSARDWEQRYAHPDQPVKQALPNEAAVFVTTIGVYNHTATDVVHVTGSLHAKDRDYWMKLDLCWIDTGRNQPVPSVGHVEVQCSSGNHGLDGRERLFLDEGAGDRFTLVWEPHTIEFADGRKLDAKL